MNPAPTLLSMEKMDTPSLPPATGPKAPAQSASPKRQVPKHPASRQQAAKIQRGPLTAKNTTPRSASQAPEPKRQDSNHRPQATALSAPRTREPASTHQRPTPAASLCAAPATRAPGPGVNAPMRATRLASGFLRAAHRRAAPKLPASTSAGRAPLVLASAG
jgi:hypothetical protein